MIKKYENLKKSQRIISFKKNMKFFEIFFVLKKMPNKEIGL